MPQPFNRILPDPHIVLDHDYWLDKTEVTGIVCAIFATWAKIETELGTMLVRILGADSAPALAMYEALNTQTLRTEVLKAAAKASLIDDELDMFLAVTSVLNSVQTPRNHLAHWVWGYCKQKPKMLALADPKMIQENRQRVMSFFEKNPENHKIDWSVTYDLIQYDCSRIIGYSHADLKRAHRDLEEAYQALLNFECVLDPGFTRSPVRLIMDEDPALVRTELLRRLNGSRLFREALDRVQNANGLKSSPPKKT